jgi:hypothetical protein
VLLNPTKTDTKDALSGTNCKYIPVVCEKACLALRETR